jgi:hypothetical protein
LGGDFITTGCPTTARRGRRTLCCDFAEYPLLQKSLIRRLDAGMKFFDDL